jgi:hypothetical protein
MKHELVYVNEYRLHLDYSVEEGLKPFKEEVLDTLNCVHKDFDIESQMFSGGMDSTFILRSLLELGLTPRLHTLSFAKDQTDYDSLRAKDQCKKFGIKEPEFFYIDKYDLFKHIDILTYEKKIAFPTLHCYYVDYFLSKMGEEKFFCGMSCEYRSSNGIVTMNVAPPVIKYFNPNRLYGFDSSKTFLSYVNDSIFKDNYLKENPIIEGYGENIWYIRDLIYNACYPEIEIITKKFPNDKHITPHFYEHKLPTIQRLHPIVFLMQPFKFNAEEYLKEKNNGS